MKKTISNICVTFFDISGLVYALPGIHAACVLVERRELTRESIQPARNLFHILALSRRQLFQWISYSASVNFKLSERNAHENRRILYPLPSQPSPIPGEILD